MPVWYPILAGWAFFRRFLATMNSGLVQSPTTAKWWVLLDKRSVEGMSMYRRLHQELLIADLKQNKAHESLRTGKQSLESEGYAHSVGARIVYFCWDQLGYI